MTIGEMKIGIIGSGNVGGALGSRWSKLGHEVVFGTHNPESGDVQKLAAQGQRQDQRSHSGGRGS